MVLDESREPSSVGAEPSLSAFETRRPAAGVTGREAILASLLLHALGLIAILLAPPAVFSARGIPRHLSAEEVPIPMRFIEDRSRPAQPNPAAPFASDRDRRRAQEEKPPNPSRMEPFARGNTQARIDQGALGQPGPPAPPAAVESAAPTPAPEPPRGAETTEAREGTGPLYVPPEGRPEGDREGDSLAAKAERLKEALDQMGRAGIGGQGGSRYKFDNPTGGLVTPGGSLSFDTKGFDWGPYARRIYWIIWSNWHARMPPAVYAGLKGAVTVHFVINRDGRITDIEILSPSGVPAYDSAATLALEASSPLPPLPENFPNPEEGVTGRFLYNMWNEE